MHNFEKRVVVHDGKEQPLSDEYCIVMMHDGDIHKAFNNDGEWIFTDGFHLQNPCVKSWFYVENIFDVPKIADIRMYIDESERCI